MLFLQVILPVFLIACAGFVFERKSNTDISSLANSALFLFAPSLVFSALVNQTVEAEVISLLAWFMVLYTAILCLLAYGIARWRKFDGNTTRAFTLTTSMMNIGNFGLPLVFFAYGEASLNVSVVLFVLFNIPLGTLAILIAQGLRIPEPSGHRFRCKLGHPFRSKLGQAFRCKVGH